MLQAPAPLHSKQRGWTLPGASDRCYFAIFAQPWLSGALMEDCIAAPAIIIYF